MFRLRQYCQPAQSNKLMVMAANKGRNGSKTIKNEAEPNPKAAKIKGPTQHADAKLPVSTAANKGTLECDADLFDAALFMVFLHRLQNGANIFFAFSPALLGKLQQCISNIQQALNPKFNLLGFTRSDFLHLLATALVRTQ